MSSINWQYITDKINELAHESQFIEDDGEGTFHITIKMPSGILCSVYWHEIYPDDIVGFSIWNKRECLISDFMGFDMLISYIRNTEEKIAHSQDAAG